MRKAETVSIMCEDDGIEHPNGFYSNKKNSKSWSDMKSPGLSIYRGMWHQLDMGDVTRGVVSRAEPVRVGLHRGGLVSLGPRTDKLR